jgi:hypothetical protein
MARINGHEVNLNKTDAMKVYETAAGIESDGREMFNMSANRDLKNIVEDNAKAKFNEKVDEYVAKLDEHEKLLQEYTESLASDLNKLEIKPLYEGVLIKPLAQNPFQKIKREGLIITDTGGLTPEYKSRETGEWEEEESFIHYGIVQEAGPTCKYLKEGDVVMWRKPSETPVPFYKQGLVLVNEHSIMITVNVGLADRFKKLMENGNN